MMKISLTYAAKVRRYSGRETVAATRVACVSHDVLLVGLVMMVIG